MSTNKVISASTIGNLISAHLDGDNERFMAFAKFIAESYEEAGDYRSARIIRNHITNVKPDVPPSQDEVKDDKPMQDFQDFKAKAGTELDKWGSIFMKTVSVGAQSAGKFLSDVSDKVEKYANNAPMTDDGKVPEESPVEKKSEEPKEGENKE